MAIGGMIGGAVDPTKMYGPHVGDGQAQSATDGAPISWVMGTMWVAGTIVDVGKRQEFKVKQSGGKGSGTEQYSYEAHQNFTIVVCESDELKGSTINQVLMVEQDGKIVYDVRPGSTMLADSQKWLARNCVFYYGDEAQLPTAADEAAHGVGNAPAYRGVLRAVFTQFNVTAVGDRIPNFRFLVTTGPQAIIVNSGGDGYGDEHVVRIPAYAGGFTLQYATGGVPDKFQVILDGDVVVDTGYHGEKAFQSQLDTFLAGKGDPSETITQYPYPTGTSYPPGVQYTDQWDSIIKRESVSFVKTSDATSLTLKHWGMDGTGWTAGIVANASSSFTLGQMAQNICARGGISPLMIDVSALESINVAGYAIAKQMNAVDALGPLLGAHFAYASEYDSKINFHFYGADAVMTIDEADILAENDANNGNITENLRNNATEFPKRIIGKYYDPAQNYMPVTVMQTRRAAGVTATGELSMDIPVVMPADQAQQTVDKALKVAYAQLEGTIDLSVPFAGKNNVYLSLVAGDPVIFRGKRWIVKELIISTGYIKLTLQYDRQSAYTSNVQAIPGLTPTPPASRYSGPTTLVPMNLPSLRTQDTYGVYLAAKGTNDQDSWRGCNVLVSYDGQQSWQNAATIAIGSVMGTLSAEIPSGGEPLTVDVGAGELDSITDAQIAANMNAFALIDANGVAEIGQFKTAELLSSGEYNLTDVSRGLLGTTEGTHAIGDDFVMLDAVYFLPIDTSFAGKTIYFRAVGFGEAAEDQPVVSLVYEPDTTIIHDGGTVTP